MGLSALVLVRRLGESSLEGVEVKWIELDGIQQSLLMIVSVKVTTHTVLDGRWIFQDLVG